MHALNKFIQELAIPVRRFATTGKSTMRLVQFISRGNRCIGVESGDCYINLTEANSSLPGSMVDFLFGGETNLVKAKESSSNQKYAVKKSEVKLLPPITNCDKVVCVGLNYKDHCLEQNFPLPEEPIIFSKFPSAISGDGDDIILPKVSDAVDWEVELAVVIGKPCRNVEEGQAMDYVAGYMVADDVSARDWQLHKNAKQWLLGKTFDTFCPIGPVLVTKDSIPDPHNLALKCLVNGEVMQSSNTNQLVFNIGSCIAWVSRICTLKPGDILLTGTPGGVGVFRKPPVYLKAGDVVTCEIEGIGKITNKVVEEK